MAPRSRAKRRSDGARVRSRIIRAAAKLFHERGIENVTFGLIAKRAGVSRPLVYFYFPTPRDLLTATFTESMRRLLARFEAASHGHATGLAGTEAIGRAYLAFHDEDPEFFFLCMSAGPSRKLGASSSPAEEELRRIEDAVMAHVVGPIQRGHADGSIDPASGDPVTVALCLWSLSHGLAQFTTMKADALAHEYHIPAPTFLAAGMRLLTRAIAARNAPA